MQQRLILYFFYLFSSNLYCQETIQQFSFLSAGMASRESVIIRRDSTFVVKQRLNDTFSKNTLTPDTTWIRLKNAISKYSLAELECLRSPTDQRAVDGASYSYIYILTDKKEYFSGDFDSYNPHEKLKDLLLVIIESLK